MMNRGLVRLNYRKGTRMISCALVVVFVLLAMASLDVPSFADDITIPSVNVEFGQPQSGNESATTVQILLFFTVIAIAPSILLMMTCFTRIIIIFSFVRRALATQTTPPNQVLIGLALFLTFFIMSPVLSEVKTNAYDPLVAGEINQEVAIDNALEPIREFMLRQVRSKDLKLFVDLADIDDISNYSEIPTSALIPAFIISELKTGFEVGFLIFIPFIVIDMIVASTLMALGMMMLPPVMISMPFKILLFIMVDGWNLIVEKIILSIR
ncbi:flagellar type III secretion system pore protein FliP [Fusibacter sp. JL216-2]|uniref:flagellar type III secretion system pore protein FliP n=1 Tax=Fusibacter sp. JL216-2 TaxID=3071453 RepID=UPI003D34E8DD